MELQIILNTLEQVEVKGSVNMGYMLGAIKLLRKIIAQQQEESEKAEEDQNAIPDSVQD